MLREYKDNQNVCKLIAELTGADKRTTRDILDRLERYTALPGIDVRFTSEIYGKVHSKLRELGLDPQDTTPQELYRTLHNLAVLHDHFLAKRLKVEHPDNAVSVAEAVERFIEKADIPKEVLALKPAVAKKLLKNTPPKELMKALHYRSIESMLKRESPDVLLAVARHFEPAKWQERFMSSYRKLDANDFEVRQIEVLLLRDKQWQLVSDQLDKARHSSILHSAESAIIAMLPTHRVNPQGLTLTTLLLVLHYINELRSTSTYFRFHQMGPNFGARLHEHLQQNRQYHLHIVGQPVHWQVAHRYFGSKIEHHPQIFEPHIQPEDLAYRKAEEVLYRLEPALHFWHELDYVGLSATDGPVSLSLTDAAMNLVNNFRYEKRVYYHMRSAVWNELYFRYAASPAIRQHILDQLEEQSAAHRHLFSLPGDSQASLAKEQGLLGDLLIIEKTPTRNQARSLKRRAPTSKTFDMEFVW